MKSLSINEIINAVNGKVIYGDIDNIIINNISTDTRTIKGGELFIPLKGENFDGHKFIDIAFKNGALCTLTQEDIKTDKIAIKVSDTKKALADLAMYYISLFNIPIIAVTGSVGKTTTKDMIASVLSQKYNVLKTGGNFNNEIGLPLTAFNIDENTEVVVFEMGMNNFNEIHNLSYIAKPDIAVITNIGVSHIENLGSRDGILKAKCEVFDFMKEKGIKILNADDDKLITLKDKFKDIIFFSDENNNMNFYASEINSNTLDGIKCSINGSDFCFSVNIPVPGKHMVSNALVATAVGSVLGLNESEIKKGIENFKPTKMRMDVIKTKGYTIINDVYNANPVSVKAAIDVIANIDTRRVCILGDMFELGDLSQELHSEVGQYAIEKNIDVLICIGDISKNMFNTANKLKSDNQEVFYFKSQEDFFTVIKDILKDKDTILIKASRGMKFEKTTEKLQGEQ